MRSSIRRALAGAAISGAALAAFAPAAAADPSIYHPVIRPCGHLFRTVFEAPRPGTEVYWSPFGTTNIVCYDDGTGMKHYFQRDPSGGWHYMNELAPGNRFYEIFTTTVPDQATW